MVAVHSPFFKKPVDFRCFPGLFLMWDPGLLQKTSHEGRFELLLVVFAFFPIFMIFSRRCLFGPFLTLSLDLAIILGTLHLAVVSPIKMCPVAMNEPRFIHLTCVRVLPALSRPRHFHATLVCGGEVSVDNVPLDGTFSDSRSEAIFG